MKQLVFTYGTLKSGFSRHNVLREQRYIGIARTIPNYKIFQFSGYPALVLVEPEPESLELGRAVYGELYEVEDTAIYELDRIEGCDKGLFERKPINLDSITMSHLPTDESVWAKMAEKVAMGYFFKNTRLLNGAKDCGGLWAHQ